MNNIQTFSSGSEQYAKHRPQYPAELFSFLNEISDEHDRAWDCATGNGQAAVSCAQYFSRVEATDVSAEQIRHSIVHPKVNYSVGPAEHTTFADQTFDLITVATAIHWFDQEQFFREVERVLKPKGILAVWGYGFFRIEPEIDNTIARVLFERIDRFWAEGNRQLMTGYRDLVLPFEEVRNPPAFAMQVEWTLGQLLAYLRTWSAVKRYSAELGNDPVTELETKLKTLWHEPDKPKLTQMPLFLKASRKPA
jgi:ubiquinone/menaquinone biosynthesis C-methylase UbiE